MPNLFSNFSPRLSWVRVWPWCQEVVLLEKDVNGKTTGEQRLLLEGRGLPYSPCSPLNPLSLSYPSPSANLFGNFGSSCIVDMVFYVELMIVPLCGMW